MDLQYGVPEDKEIIEFLKPYVAAKRVGEMLRRCVWEHIHGKQDSSIAIRPVPLARPVVERDNTPIDDTDPAPKFAIRF
jgi:hypothetical protein